jgi:hypothetical protein
MDDISGDETAAGGKLCSQETYVKYKYSQKLTKYERKNTARNMRYD